MFEPGSPQEVLVPFKEGATGNSKRFDRTGRLSESWWLHRGWKCLSRSGTFPIPECHSGSCTDTWQRSRVTATEGEGASCSPLCQKPRGLLKQEQQPVPETFR